MSKIVTDTGFSDDTWVGEYVVPDAIADQDRNVSALDLPSDIFPSELAGQINDWAMIRIDFPSFADGRGFTIARQLRLMGFTGTLRAKGHVISDQYAMARRSGFDEVEIDDALATRQPEPEWLARANWQSHDYQNRMRG